MKKSIVMSNSKRTRGDRSPQNVDGDNDSPDTKRTAATRSSGVTTTSMRNFMTETFFRYVNNFFVSCSLLNLGM